MPAGIVTTLCVDIVVGLCQWRIFQPVAEDVPLPDEEMWPVQAVRRKKAVNFNERSVFTLYSL